VDAFRYWVAGASLGGDLPFKEQELVAGQKFVTKLWNASKFAFMSLSDYSFSRTTPKNLLAIDIWMLQKLSKTAEKVKELYEKYNISGAKRELESFFWTTLCDNYLEIIKSRIYSGTKEQKESAQYVLYQSLLAVIKMSAPITCFITEEIYQTYFRKYEQSISLHISEWPEFKIKEDDKLEESGDVFIEVLTKIRQEKAKAQKSLKTEIILTLEKEKISKLKDLIFDLKAVTNAKDIREGSFNIEFLN
jgi:valyl-tRNA synthetase